MTSKAVAIGAALALLSLSGCDNPASTVANWFWPTSAAPWEEVIAVYYPNKHDLTVHQLARNVGSLENCRAWVGAKAARYNDPNLERGDYECGVGRLRTIGDLLMYRLTVR
jgi:hypothetical protein